ncbi:lipoate--protein ligase family protein [Candidatus Marinamargulisbacteria bacterium]|nr:lipoate--protein ligase family protein [Candidatus Marinamargulisbacteria bacterium]
MSIRIMLDATGSTQDHLDQDNAYLTALDQDPNQEGILRFWESDAYCVVLGRSGSIEDDVYASRCNADAVQILRRSSGGGTVLQGPGCLSYSLIMPIQAHDAFKTIGSTNTFIMQTMADSFRDNLSTVSVQGHTDLTIGTNKFSGNAQRRLRHALLFHGTILYSFDLDKISYYLKQPPKQPEYRNNRPHGSFIVNCKLSRNQIFDYLTYAWRSVPMHARLK